MARDIQLDSIVREFLGDVSETTEKVLAEVAEESATHMRDYILSAGTGREWDASWDTMPHATPGRHGSSPGRVAGGEIIASIGSESHSAAWGAEARFGWIGDTVPTYILAQEYGFTHNITHEDISGMNSLADAEDFAVNEVEKRLGGRLRAL